MLHHLSIFLSEGRRAGISFPADITQSEAKYIRKILRRIIGISVIDRRTQRMNRLLTLNDGQLVKETEKGISRLEDVLKKYKEVV